MTAGVASIDRVRPLFLPFLPLFPCGRTIPGDAAAGHVRHHRPTHEGLARSRASNGHGHVTSRRSKILVASAHRAAVPPARSSPPVTTVCPTGAPTVVCEFWPIHEMASVKSNHRAKDGAAWTAVYSITHGRHHLEADASSSSTRAQRANIRTPTPTPTTRRSAIIGVIVSRNRETGPGSPALRFLRVLQRFP